MTNGTDRLVKKLWSYCNVLRDDSLEDSADLPDPHIIAAEIAEDLESALEQIRDVLVDLEERAAIVEESAP